MIWRHAIPHNLGSTPHWAMTHLIRGDPRLHDCVTLLLASPPHYRMAAAADLTYFMPMLPPLQ